MGAVLVRRLVQQLETQADAEVPRAAIHRVHDCAVEPDPAEAAHGGSAGAYARHDHEIGAVEIIATLGNGHRSTGDLHCLGDAQDVAGVVVDHCSADDLHASWPLVLGMPLRRGSTATASRKARARALNDASAMW